MNLSPSAAHSISSNCIVPPRSEEVRGRIFTTVLRDILAAKHIEADENDKKDFSEIIALAKTLPSPDEIETAALSEACS